MTENNKDIIEVPVTPIEAEETVTDANLLDLSEVGYMVVVGRKLNGETFFRTVNIDDLLLIDGLVNYAKRKVNHTFEKHFESEDQL
jgi:hypothetical protein